MRAEQVIQMLFKKLDANVISLNTRPDRKRRVLKQLKKLRVDSDLITFYGVDPCKERGLFATAGKRGCFLSHLALLKKCVASGKAMLIMEDDVEFQAHILELHAEVLHSIDTEEWDILYFGVGNLNSVHASTIGISNFSEYTNGMYCYAIRPKMAEQLVAYLQDSLHRIPGHPLGGCIDVDGAVNDFRMKHTEFKARILFPLFAGFFESRTNLGFEKWFDRIIFLRPFLESLRELKQYIRTTRAHGH